MDKRTPSKFSQTGKREKPVSRDSKLVSSKSNFTAAAMLVVGIVVVGTVMGAGTATVAVVLSYFMPVELARKLSESALPAAAVIAMIAGSIFLKPKPLSPEERDRFYSLKGETYDEVKELIGFNLRLGNREKANEWAIKLKDFSSDESELKLERKD